MTRITRQVSVSTLLVGILVCGAFATGQQSVTQPKTVPTAKSRTAQSDPGKGEKVADQLAQVQEQLKQLQDTIEAMHSEQQLMKVGLESAVRSAAQNSLGLGEITHALAENGKAIDGLDRQLQVVNRWADHVSGGVGILLERTNTLPSDLRQIKSRLGLY